MKLIQKLFVLVVAIATILVSVTPAFAAYSTMYVTQSNKETVRLRKKPSTSSVVLKNVPHGTAVQAEKYNSSWHRVKVDGKSGYMMSSFLSSKNPNNNPGQNPAPSPDNGWIDRYGKGVMNTGAGQNKHVLNLQSDLNCLGYNLGEAGVDGRYGSATTKAVEEFQKRYGLGEDGMAGPETKAKLYEIAKDNNCKQRVK